MPCCHIKSNHQVTALGFWFFSDRSPSAEADSEPISKVAPELLRHLPQESLKWRQLYKRTQRTNQNNHL